MNGLSAHAYIAEVYEHNLFIYLLMNKHPAVQCDKKAAMFLTWVELVIIGLQSGYNPAHIFRPIYSAKQCMVICKQWSIAMAS